MSRAFTLKLNGDDRAEAFDCSLMLFGEKREGQGNGLLAVAKPDGRKRSIFFEKGRATGYDESQAEWSAFKATRQGDLTIVHIGEERYEIPDAVINGG